MLYLLIFEDFFRLDGESDEAQSAQNEILKKLAGGSKDLFEEFKDEEQEEPIILSADGYVINGNRRLSTWRSLFEEDPAKYARFSNVQAVVLPICEEKDLDRLEAELQLKEDLKAEYSWISQALMMREKMKRFGYKEKDIAAIYDLKTNELHELLDCLDYADEYLISRGLSRKYSAVDGKEFAFRQICRSRKKVKSPQEIEVFEKSAFCLADDAAEGTRTYAEIQKAAEHIKRVTDDLANEFDVDRSGKTEEQVAELIVSILDEPKNFDRARDTIQEAISSATAKERERKKELQVSSRVLDARNSLIDAKSAIDGASSKKGVSATLTEIEELVTNLRMWAESDD